VSRAAPGIGRGLEAILSASAERRPRGESELRELPVDLISANPRQPRGRFDEETLRALAASLAERGVLQPVLVRPRPGGSYELLAGERRWRAARLAGLETIPALVRERDDAESLELAVIENMAREDLNPVDEARACAALVEELGLTREQIASRTGRARSSVSNLIRLLDLPDDVLEALEQGTLSEGHGRALLLADDHSARRKLARRAAAEGWSVRTTEARARDSNASGARNGKPARGAVRPSHADQEEALRAAGESLSEALGIEVRAQPLAGGAVRAVMTFASHADALKLARRLGARTQTKG
jgi:ParB family chromosome partitioning protein